MSMTFNYDVRVAVATSPRIKPTVPSSSPRTRDSNAFRHLSPRKFQQQQREQRAALLRSLPLSPLSLAHVDPAVKKPAKTSPIPWNPAWLPSPDDPESGSRPNSKRTPRGCNVRSGITPLNDWIQDYELEFLRFESLDQLVQAKLPEALAFCDKLSQQQQNLSVRESSGRFHERFRIAVFAHLMDRAVLALAQSATLSHLQPTLLQARQELLRAIYTDYDDLLLSSIQANSGKAADHDSDSSDDDDEQTRRQESVAANDQRWALGPAEPRTFGFFLAKTPFAVKMREDSQRRAAGFKRNKAALRRVIQTMYQSLGSVFHAWRLYVRRKKEDRLNHKGAQLTAMVVMHRGLMRSVFVEWSKATLRAKIRSLCDKEAENARVQAQEVADLRKEIFLLREKNANLQAQLQGLESGNLTNEPAGIDSDATVERTGSSVALTATMETEHSESSPSEVEPAVIPDQDSNVPDHAQVEDAIEQTPSH